MAARKNKINQYYFRFSVFMLVIIALLLTWFVAQQIGRRKGGSKWDDSDNTYTSYPGFGIRIPDGYTIHGIDVSRYQKRINWTLVKQMNDNGIQLRFAFMKATEGTDLIDLQFERNWRKAKESGITRGAYHFFRQNTSGHQQAMNFIKQVKLSTGDLPPVLDVETYHGNDLESFLEEVVVWLKVVEDYYKVKPIIYTNAGFYNQYLAAHLAGYTLWVAHYTDSKNPRIERQWHFWQHNETGRVNGIRSMVDFNVFKGTESEFTQLLMP